MAIYSIKTKDMLVPEVKSVQDTYELHTKAMHNLTEPPPPPRPSSPPPPPLPPPPCLVDIVVGCKVGESTSGAPAMRAFNDFVEHLVTELDPFMDGSISGYTNPLMTVQVGTFCWAEGVNDPCWNGGSGSSPNGGTWVQWMSTSSSVIKADAVNSGYGWPHSLHPEILGVRIGGGSSFDKAVDMGMTMLDAFGTLGNRSSQPNYKRIMIILTDSEYPQDCDVPCFTTNMSTDVWNVGTIAGNPELDVEVYVYNVQDTGVQPVNWLSKIECLINPPDLLQGTHAATGVWSDFSTFATSLAHSLCSSIGGVSWNCSSQFGVSLPNGTVIPPLTCYDPGHGQGQFPSLGLCNASCNSMADNCLLDIVIAVDVSGSTYGPGSNGLSSWGLPPPANPPNNPLPTYFGRYDDNSTTTPGSINIATGLPNSNVSNTVGGYTGNPGPFEAQRMLLEKLIDHLTPGMIAGTTQVGVVFWGDEARSIDPDGFSMTTNHQGDLSTTKTIPDGHGDLHSPIAFHMMDHYGASNMPPTPGTNGQGPGTDIGLALDTIFGGGTVSGGVITDKTSSALVSQYPARQNDPYFIQVGVVITDSKNSLNLSGISGWPSQPGVANPESGCVNQSAALIPHGTGNQIQPSTGWTYGQVGPAKQYVVGCVARPGEFTNLPNTGGNWQQTWIKNTLDAITCGHNSGTNAWNTSTVGDSFGFYIDINETDPTEPDSATFVAEKIALLPCETVQAQASYNCTLVYDPLNAPSGSLYVGHCDPVIGSGGQFTTTTAAQGGYTSALDECQHNCQERVAPIDPVLVPIDDDPCEKCCCESTLIPPWTCIPGTQVMTAPNVSPCLCSSIGMIDCTDDLGPAVYGYNCPPTLGPPCVGPLPGGAYTAATAALQPNPATPGNNYPNTLAGALAWCNDSCTATIGTVYCPKIQSCPCGWNPMVINGPAGVFNCTFDDPIAGLVQMPAIIGDGTIPNPACLSFPPPVPSPAVGDVWAHSGSYAGYSWTDVQVVDTTQFMTGSAMSVGARTNCNP